MNTKWTTAAKKVGLDAQQIPDVLQALQMDPEQPSPSTSQIKLFKEAAQLVVEGKAIAEAVGQVIGTDIQQAGTFTRDTIRETYPDMADDLLNPCLELLGVGPQQEQFSAAVLAEFKELRGFMDAGQLGSWDEVVVQWKQYKSGQQVTQDDALTVSQSGAMVSEPPTNLTVPSTIPAEIQENLAAPILESVDADVEEIPGKMAEYHQEARSNVMGGLNGFVKSTYYGGMNTKLQSPEFVEEVRKALRLGKSPASSES